jgi:hypothetical protein
MHLNKRWRKEDMRASAEAVLERNHSIMTVRWPSDMRSDRTGASLVKLPRS